jgi:hypothetical protein
MQQQQGQAVRVRQPTQQRQAVQQQGRALLHLPAKRRARLAARQLLLLLVLLAEAMVRLPSQQQQQQGAVARLARGLVLQRGLALRCETLAVAAWVLLQLRSMRASLAATTAWTCRSRQTDRWGLAGICRTRAQQCMSAKWTGSCSHAACLFRVPLHSAANARGLADNAVHRPEHHACSMMGTGDLPSCCAALPAC